MSKQASDNKKEITLRYFAALREQRGLAQEQRRTTARTPRQLYQEIQREFGFSLPIEALRVAVNQEFRDMDTVLCSGDELAFIPPVSGG